MAESKGKKIKELELFDTVRDTDDIVVETSPEQGSPKTGRTKLETVKEMFNREINSDLEKISPLLDKVNDITKNVTSIQEDVDSIQNTLDQELTNGTTGSTGNQGIFKGQSGIMILWGASQTTIFSYNSTGKFYKLDITFREKFKEAPIVMTSPRYASGIPENVGTLSTTASKTTLGCNTAARGLWIEWIAIGKWK